MMDNKTQSIAMLKDELDLWDAVLSDLSDGQAASTLYTNRSIKDDVAHLWVWQRISVARMEAAVNESEPHLEWFPEEFAPEAEEDLHNINEWIYQTNKDVPWSEVYQRWRDGFLRFIDLAEMVPEEDLLAPGKYPWLAEYPLIAVLEGLYDHHHGEHLPALLEWLHQNES
jgi:hypothetical protein